MKYKCIRSYHSGEWLTKDKIYEDIDGKFTYDDGYTSRTFSMNNKLRGHEMNYYLEEIKEDNNMKREFKVGDKVRIRQWDDMAKEFGVDGYDDIKTIIPFVTNMRPLCGEECVITDIRKNWIKLKFKSEEKISHNYQFSTDMIEHINPTVKTLTITTSDTTTTLTDGVHTTTINRYHTDKHDEQTAVNSVIDKYYDELKQIEIEKNKPKVGDMVRVVDRGYLFPSFHQWLELEDNNVPLKTAIKWRYNNEDIKDKEYKIVCLHKHTFDGGMVALIEDYDDAFIIRVEGLEVVR